MGPSVGVGPSVDVGPSVGGVHGGPSGGGQSLRGEREGSKDKIIR